jgi:cell division protein FtsX
MIRMRIFGSRDNADTLVNTLRGIDGIEHVEDVDEESMDEMRDDSSSSELSDDNQGDIVRVEIEAPHKQVEMVRNVAELGARELGLVVEFVDEF